MGAEAMNHYAEFLHTMIHGGGIWIFRAVLLTAVGLHIWAAVTLTLDNLAARPVGYRAQQHSRPPPGPPAPCAGAASSWPPSSSTTCCT